MSRYPVWREPGPRGAHTPSLLSGERTPVSGRGAVPERVCVSGEGVDLCLGREPGQGVPSGRQGVCRGFRLEVVCTWTKRPQGMPAGPGAVERMTFRSHGGPGGDRTVLPAWSTCPASRQPRLLFSRQVMSSSLLPHGLQHARP